MKSHVACDGPEIRAVYSLAREMNVPRARVLIHLGAGYSLTSLSIEKQFNLTPQQIGKPRLSDAQHLGGLRLRQLSLRCGRSEHHNNMKKSVLSMQQMREAVRGMQFNQLVGIRLVRIHKDGVTIDCKLRPELMNTHGALHGGVTATLADAAVGIAITTRVGRPTATTVEMKLNYLRPVLGGTITARARLLRMGSTLCVGRVDLFNDAKEMVAAALVTYMLIK